MSRELSKESQAKKFKKEGISASELKSKGFEVEHLHDAGFKLGELKEAGFTPKLLKRVGYSIEDLKKAGFKASEFKNERCKPPECGTRLQVYQGIAKKTSGGLRKEDLTMVNGKPISLKKHISAKKEQRLQAYGYGPNEKRDKDHKFVKQAPDFKIMNRSKRGTMKKKLKKNTSISRNVSKSSIESKKKSSNKKSTNSSD